IKTLAQKAHHMALGGLDIIKDDHSLTNQPFGPYAERVTQISAAIHQANTQTGHNTLYFANITAPTDQIWDRAHLAKQQGAGGFLICPGLTGFDTMRALADDDTLALPIISHPSLLGAFVTNQDHGIEHGVLFGTLNRLAGADAAVFTNYGGRFAFTINECQSIAHACTAPLHNIAPIFPVPAGGMTLDRIKDLHQTYGHEVTYLIGGALIAHSPDLTANCKHFKTIVAQETAT
ncbi:hypothetical protein TI04_10605, partial [Achromatium sp. WMS2]